MNSKPRQITRQHWYEVDKVCCGTCKHSSVFGGERPPSGWALCEITDTTVRVFQDTTCKNYERGIVLRD